LAVLAALNVIGYASVKAYECLALFLLTGYGMHCYCSNKSLAILAALFVANFVFGCGRVKEGFEEAMKAPGDLLKDAANAAAEAGGQLAKEGAAGMVEKCSKLAITAATVSADCENGNYTQDGETKSDDSANACNFTKAIKAKCMNNGVEVDAADAAACTALGDGHTYEEATAATCA